MSTFTVEFAYNLFDVVYIKATKQMGELVGWWVDRNGIPWAGVEYVDDVKCLHTAWFTMREIQAAVPK